MRYRPCRGRDSCEAAGEPRREVNSEECIRSHALGRPALDSSSTYHVAKCSTQPYKSGIPGDCLLGPLTQQLNAASLGNNGPGWDLDSALLEG